MSFVIHLLILILLPCISGSPYEYGIVRNASINPSVNVNHSLSVRTCNDCLCYAFNHSNQVDFFSCTQNESNALCQFYHPIPTRDEIEYPTYNSSIYLMKNETFKDNCCNTEYLVHMIKKASPESNTKHPVLLALTEGEENTIVASSPTSVIKYNKSTLEIISTHALPGKISMVYWDKRYYLGTTTSIEVYDETLTTTVTPNIDFGMAVTTIRFLNGTYMLVGVFTTGVYIYEKDANGNFTIPIPELKIAGGKQIHAIGIWNESAFYVGWDSEYKDLIFFTRNPDNSWLESKVNAIPYPEKTSDIVVDKTCQRIWVAEAYTNRIFIYDLNQPTRYEITVMTGLFNLLIFEDSNYTLFSSHGSPNGLSRIQPAVDCRPPR